MDPKLRKTAPTTTQASLRLNAVKPNLYGNLSPESYFSSAVRTCVS
jgi:hypothetical protein